MSKLNGKTWENYGVTDHIKWNYVTGAIKCEICEIEAKIPHGADKDGEESAGNRLAFERRHFYCSLDDKETDPGV